MPQSKYIIIEITLYPTDKFYRKFSRLIYTPKIILLNHRNHSHSNCCRTNRKSRRCTKPNQP